MLHELINIFNSYEQAAKQGVRAVMATVVALEGSSYRRPGVRMLILESGVMTGAVSGGCVEKEIKRQAGLVFKSQTPKMMIYDGRYRLGCEGILYLLLEPFLPDQEFVEAFRHLVKQRKTVTLLSYFSKEDGTSQNYGTCIDFSATHKGIRPDFMPTDDIQVFRHELPPFYRLMILGAEHDAVQLCRFAVLTGWEVTIVAPPSEEKDIGDFPGASVFMPVQPEEMVLELIDHQTFILVMTHSYASDLRFLTRLKDSRPGYLGLLGPTARRERLLNELMERNPEIDDDYFDRIHGPAGLSIGAESAQEIAIAIMAEILSYARGMEPIPLKDKNGRIHSQ